MKKVLSLILALALIASMFTVAASAYSVSDEGALSAKEAVEAYEEEEGEEVETQRIYFQMPNGNRGGTAEKDVIVNKDIIDEETGEVIGSEDYVALHAGDKAPSWYSDYNIVDGQSYAGAYWWGGPAACDSWCGYRMEIEDYDQGIYYVDVPKDVVIMIFNNGVDGGTDTTDPIYYEAAQTVDTNIEGAYEDDYESIPYGSPDNDFFDGCIYVIDPNQVSINAFSQKQTCGANWYVYYGDGCYGQEFGPGAGDGNNDYPDGTPDWSEDVADICMNPDHFDAAGHHVGYQGGEVHTHTLEAVAKVPATTEAAGVKAHYKCTGCGKLFLDEEATQEVTLEELAIPMLVLDPNKFYFDASTTGWNITSKTKIAFNIYGGDLTNALDWGSKKLLGTAVANQDGLFEFDPSKVSYVFNEGVQYQIIFVQVDSGVWSNQTYDLLFTSECLGHVAYCDGTEYENPVDSSKKTLAAFWRGMDASLYGPKLQVSSIGNVVGTCPEAGKTPESIFVDFLTVVNEKTGTTMYANADHYVVEPGTKTDQKLIDDIGTDLGLTKQQVYDAFTNNEVETTWDWTVSTLPGTVTPAHTHTPGEPQQENVKAATCTAAGSYDEVVYCTGCGEELSRETKVIAQLEHTPAAAVRENVKAATCTAAGSYDAVVYCSSCHTELSRTKKTIAKLGHNPGYPVQENVVPATCTAAGSYDEVTYCTRCNTEISRETKTIAKLAHTLKGVPKVEATETTTGMKAHYECTVCGKYFLDKAGTNEVTAASLIIPMLAHTHTPGAAQQENVVPATCTSAGSYDEVVYCTGCGAELSRETKTIAKLAHTIKGFAKVEATETSTGMKAHYECTVCGKCFTDKAGTNEVSRESLIIPMLAHTHTPGAAQIENNVPATCHAPGSYDEVVYCTGCGEELSRETVDVAQLEHVAGKTKRENIVPATCTSKGSYDDNVYCTLCGDLLSSTHGTIAKKAHTLTHFDQVDATATKDGMKEHYKCSVCGKYFSDAEGKNEVTKASLVIPATGTVDNGILGDVDGDGEVTIIDVTCIQRILVGLIEPDDGMLLRGDIDKLDDIDITDATFIQRWLLGIPTAYAIGDPIA